MKLVLLNSKENILQQISSFPYIGGWFKLFGLFDGDQRIEITNKYQWNYSFLPSKDAPEKLLKKIAKSNRVELANITGRDIRSINIALAALDGKDHHDWIVEFPRHIGIGYEQLIAFLLEISMTDTTIKKDIDDAFHELISSLYS